MNVDLQTQPRQLGIKASICLLRYTCEYIFSLILTANNSFSFSLSSSSLLGSASTTTVVLAPGLRVDVVATFAVVESTGTLVVCSLDISLGFAVVILVGTLIVVVSSDGFFVVGVFIEVVLSGLSVGFCVGAAVDGGCVGLSVIFCVVVVVAFGVVFSVTAGVVAVGGGVTDDNK